MISINMLMPIGRKIFFSAVLALFLVPGFFCVTARAETQFSILVTSNLQGNFSLNTENQETTDPLLILGQNIIAERHNGIDLYLDMGNALYPGVLAKYSTGSIMVDFLEYFSCAAFLVSSKDLQIGTKNLEFMQKDKRVRFLSANIAQDGKPIFTSWFAQDLVDGRSIVMAGEGADYYRLNLVVDDGVQLKSFESRRPIPFPPEITGIRNLEIVSPSGRKNSGKMKTVWLPS